MSKYLDHQEIVQHMRGYIRGLWRMEQISHIWAEQILDVQEHGDGRAYAWLIGGNFANEAEHGESDAAYIASLQAAIDDVQARLMEYEAAGDMLNKNYRRAVHLVDFEGGTLTDAAKVLQTDESTIREWERRGLLDMALIFLQARGVCRDWMQAPKVTSTRHKAHKGKRQTRPSSRASMERAIGPIFGRSPSIFFPCQYGAGQRLKPMRSNNDLFPVSL